MKDMTILASDSGACEVGKPVADNPWGRPFPFARRSCDRSRCSRRPTILEEISATLVISFTREGDRLILRYVFSPWMLVGKIVAVAVAGFIVAVFLYAAWNTGNGFAFLMALLPLLFVGPAIWGSETKWAEFDLASKSVTIASARWSRQSLKVDAFQRIKSISLVETTSLPPRDEQAHHSYLNAYTQIATVSPPVLP